MMDCTEEKDLATPGPSVIDRYFTRWYKAGEYIFVNIDANVHFLFIYLFKSQCITRLMLNVSCYVFSGFIM